MTANPTNNWLKSRFYDKYKTDQLPKGVCYIQVRIFDNPFVPQAYLDNLLEQLPRYQYEVFVEGNWDLQMKTGGEFYKCFELDKHVNLVAYDPELPLHVSFDDNVNPYLACGIFQIDGKEFRMIDEIAGRTPNNTVAAVCREIIRRYPNHHEGMFIYGDATARKDDTKMEKGYDFYRLIMDYLKQYNPSNRVLPSNLSVVLRANWINTIFEKELDGLKIVIGLNCKLAINDFVMTKEDENGKKFKEMETDPKTKVRSHKVGHFLDNFEYAICTAFSNEFEQYRRGGVIQPILFGKNPMSKNSY